MKKLIIAGKEFDSRLFLGTGKFHSNATMEEAILASGCEMVTVAMKRIELDDKEDDMLKHIIHPHIQLLPNTSGVRTAEEAVFAAQMAREAFGTNWALSFCLIARQTPLCANVWKKPVPQPSCLLQLPSVPIKAYRHVISCASSSSNPLSPW